MHFKSGRGLPACDLSVQGGEADEAVVGENLQGGVEFIGSGHSTANNLVQLLPGENVPVVLLDGSHQMLGQCRGLIPILSGVCVTCPCDDFLWRECRLPVVLVGVVPVPLQQFCDRPTGISVDSTDERRQVS